MHPPVSSQKTEHALGLLLYTDTMVDPPAAVCTPEPWHSTPKVTPWMARHLLLPYGLSPCLIASQTDASSFSSLLSVSSSSGLLLAGTEVSETSLADSALIP